MLVGKKLDNVVGIYSTPLNINTCPIVGAMEETGTPWIAVTLFLISDIFISS